MASDISEPALKVAAQNAQMHNVTRRMKFIQSDWFCSVEGEFDLIISNPPYISERELDTLEPDVIHYDPRIALTPGGDGLDPYRIIAAQAQNYLSEQGRVIVEIGHLQGKDVSQLFLDAGFSGVRILQDLEGKDRSIVANHPV